MKTSEINELVDITYQLVWNMCNEIACSDCHYYDHFHSVEDCPVNKLVGFADRMQTKGNGGES